ncbi:protein translocase subunit SecD [Demequina zhanjiangensis]|uniref:Protein translocase subunit SecD n=1 Tax=Demequina zhanjiangensis TaxID=3051659 RepID=A0ABT8G0U6_9MICO|nr:protein translocase subunit SecD [Demequina sp. SYSU T00b26]MDN4472771.1 protein translocase subunit SecD [Demequina sp. SYSU T00b26]
MSTAVKAARRALIWLGIILVAGYGALAAGVLTNQTTLAPGLALDLAGGVQLTLQATTTDGSEVTEDDLEQAVEIIRKRVDASGVAEAEISTQGSSVIVVSLPGDPSDETIDLVRQSAQLQFRPVLEINNPGPIATTDTTTDPTAEPSASADPGVSASASPSASADAAAEDASAAESANAASPSASASASASAEPDTTTDPATSDDPAAGTASDLSWITDDLRAQADALNCVDPANYLGGVALGDPDTGHAACAFDGTLKFLLGPVELTGSEVDSATSGPEFNSTGGLTGRYEVVINFTSTGADVFDEISQRLIQLPSPQNQFAIMLDGVVISYPVMQSRISDGTASITGDFTQAEAQQLANQLQFGALPLQLELQSQDVVPATLGQDQLQAGLIAGLIGLILVVIYSVFQYRVLGLVTVGSLFLAGIMTFLAIDLLYWMIGYRLSLAGVAGLIVAIGVTADSFIVYFERVRDELREGKSLQAAIDRGWKRAKRTILASDAINILAAVVLYLLAVGSVRGFAFTLGLTTVIDIIIVFLFTHPILVLLSRTKFFGEGHPWSGLDPRQLGRDTLYKGRGRVATPKTQTLAERKAAAAKGEEN